MTEVIHEVPRETHPYHRRHIKKLTILVWDSFHIYIPVILSIASSDFYRLLITIANSLDPDQDGQIVGPDLVPNLLTLE